MSTEETADGVFALLSDEIRVDILRAVAIAQNEVERAGTGIAELSFTDIYDRVDVDNTSKLSYHLGELTGTFLRKHDSGYSFSHAGERLSRFILAENFLQPPDFGTIETDGTCLFCGATALEAVLHEQYFMVRCSACDRPSTGYVITPAQVQSHERDELLESLKRKQTAEYELVQQGTCPECAGRVETDVRDASETALPDGVPVRFLTVSECQQCLRIYNGPLVYSVAYHPASVAFHWDRGIDITGTGIWELATHVRTERWTAEQLDSDPPRYRVVFRRDGATLEVVLDENAQVIRTERVRRRNPD